MDKINRINQLSRKSKASGLSAEEKLEQQALREEYLQSLRSSMKNQLLSIKVVDETGADVTPDKLKKEKEKKKLH